MDFAAGFLEILGVYVVGNRNRYGFLICLSCNAAWIASSLQYGMYGLLLASSLMACVNVRNFLRWQPQGE